MKVVILAGGYGSRMEEYTKTIPKPMIRLNNTPIIIKSMSDDVESTLYISPYVYTRENMDTDEIVESVLNDIINDISEN